MGYGIVHHGNMVPWSESPPHHHHHLLISQQKNVVKLPGGRWPGALLAPCCGGAGGAEEDRASIPHHHHPAKKLTFLRCVEARVKTGEARVLVLGASHPVLYSVGQRHLQRFGVSMVSDTKMHRFRKKCASSPKVIFRAKWGCCYRMWPRWRPIDLLQRWEPLLALNGI